MEMLTRFSRQGGWVLLQNIHLTPAWTAGPLTSFVTRLGQAGVHEEFRCVGGGAGAMRQWQCTLVAGVAAGVCVCVCARARARVCE